VFRRGGKARLVDSEQLDAFFDALDHLDEAELLRMRAAWRSVGRPVHEAAWAGVRAVGDRDGLAGEIDRIRGRALAWASRGTNTRPTPISDDMTWLDIKHEATEAIVDVALGIALGDRLDEATRSTLMLAWDPPEGRNMPGRGPGQKGERP
jgi:hypothetical protein